MKNIIPYMDEFRNPDIVRKLNNRLNAIADPRRTLTFMEVCGTHTMSIFRFGIRQLLPPWIRLISGPGCPVCVTDESYIAQACQLGSREDVIIVTFGDLMPVPGGEASLEKIRGRGADVRVVYSPRQSLDICRENPDKQVVYLAVGFETTTPLTASLVQEAKQKNIENLSLLVAHKLVPPVMKILLDDPHLQLDGFICPPHVCAITGAKAFSFIPDQWHKACAIAGFESVDILSGILSLVEQNLDDDPKVENLYKRVVTDEGNVVAQKLVEKVYKPVSDAWRGLGTVDNSGCQFTEEFARFDAFSRFTIPEVKIPKSGCQCGDILKGYITPKECPLFGKKCVPEHPIGPCMVSTEGTCAAYYKYDYAPVY